MATLRSPDGKETFQSNDPAEIAHYQQLGARLEDFAPGSVQFRTGAVPSEMPLQETHPIEGAMMLASVPGLIRGLPAMAGAAGELASGAGAYARGVADPLSKVLIGTTRARALTQLGKALIGRGAAKAAAPVASEAAPALEGLMTGPLGATVERQAVNDIPGTVASRTRPNLGVVEGGAPEAGSAASRQQAASEAGKKLAAHRWGNVEPAPAEAPAPSSRHDVQYYSESKGQHVNIEDMHPSHLRSAVNKLGKEIQALGRRAAPVKRAQFEALKKELDYRMQNGGLTAY